MSASALPLVQVKGSPRERGRQQGEGARLQIRKALESYRKDVPVALKLTWEEALRGSRKLLPYAEGAFPAFVEEVRGMAEGASVPFGEVWVLNCYEGLVESSQQVWGCTCLAVSNEHTADGGLLLAHNEDWRSADRDTAYLLRSEPDDAPPFFGLCYGPLLANVGFNAAGIAVAVNSVYATDGRAGIPRIIFSRAVLQARTLGQAIRGCVPKLRAGGYSYLLADHHGELCNVEASATAHAVTMADGGWVVHTNHYLSPKMQALEQPGVYAGSHVRLGRARRLLRARLGAVTVGDLQAILRDHVNHPNSICGHPDVNLPPHEQDMTIASLVMDLSQRTLWAAPGPPCESDYVAYQL